jgi:hypothetical protein
MNRVDNMKRVARVLCTVAGAGSTHTDEQLFSLESTFVSRKFTPTLIDSVPRMVKEAALLKNDDMLPEIEKILKGNKFSKKDKQDLVLDLLRVVAVASFPREQCDAIYSVAQTLGYDESEMKGIVELIEAERLEALANDESLPGPGRDRDDTARRTSLTPKAA